MTVTEEPSGMSRDLGLWLPAGNHFTSPVIPGNPPHLSLLPGNPSCLRISSWAGAAYRTEL